MLILFFVFLFIAQFHEIFARFRNVVIDDRTDEKKVKPKHLGSVVTNVLSNPKDLNKSEIDKVLSKLKINSTHLRG